MAQVAVRPRHPQTPHYTGDGASFAAGETVSRRVQFRPGILWARGAGGRGDTQEITASTPCSSRNSVAISAASSVEFSDHFSTR